MEVTVETLRRTIGALNDVELLRRWSIQLFTEEALPVAEAELARRGLDTSVENIERVISQERSSLRESRSIRYVKHLSPAIAAAAGAGLLVYGVVGVVIGSVAGWPLGKWLATRIDSSFDATWLRFLLGAIAFVFVFYAALVVSLLAGAALSGEA